MTSAASGYLFSESLRRTLNRSWRVRTPSDAEESGIRVTRPTMQVYTNARFARDERNGGSRPQCWASQGHALDAPNHRIRSHVLLRRGVGALRERLRVRRLRAAAMWPSAMAKLRTRRCGCGSAARAARLADPKPAHDVGTVKRLRSAGVAPSGRYFDFSPSALKLGHCNARAPLAARRVRS
jgi:hypothetical protein